MCESVNYMQTKLKDAQIANIITLVIFIIIIHEHILRILYYVRIYLLINIFI
jgi:hypothetical protein